MVMKLREVGPIRHDEASAFVTTTRGCEFRSLTIPVYPPPAVDVRGIRRAAGLSLGQVAQRLGLRPSDVSGLELGRLEPVEPGGWDAVRAALVVRP